MFIVVISVKDNKYEIWVDILHQSNSQTQKTRSNFKVLYLKSQVVEGEFCDTFLSPRIDRFCRADKADLYYNRTNRHFQQMRLIIINYEILFRRVILTFEIHGRNGTISWYSFGLFINLTGRDSLHLCILDTVFSSQSSSLSRFHQLVTQLMIHKLGNSCKSEIWKKSGTISTTL